MLLWGCGKSSPSEKQVLRDATVYLSRSDILTYLSWEEMHRKDEKPTTMDTLLELLEVERYKILSTIKVVDIKRDHFEKDIAVATVQMGGVTVNLIYQLNRYGWKLKGVY